MTSDPEGLTGGEEKMHHQSVKFLINWIHSEIVCSVITAAPHCIFPFPALWQNKRTVMNYTVKLV